jgi:glycosyltransferase involved in cell wall biosynthesis
LAQSYQNIEVLVSDNASTDETIATLRSVKDQRLRVVSNDEDVGMSENFSRCIQEARGDYLVLASDDNFFDPSFLEKCVSLVRLAPGIPIVLAVYDILVVNEFSDNGTRIVPAVTSKKLTTGLWDGTEILDEYLIGRISAQCLSSVIRTDILRRNGGYSPRPCAGDEATWIPILLEGRAGLVNERCATYMVHGCSQSSAVSADSRFMDLCGAMDEVSALAESKIQEPALRLKVQKLTARYRIHQAMITLVLFRRAGASLADIFRKLRGWMPMFRECSLRDLTAAVRLRSLGRIVLPAPVARQLMAFGADKLV